MGTVKTTADYEAQQEGFQRDTAGLEKDSMDGRRQAVTAGQPAEPDPSPSETRKQQAWQILHCERSEQRLIFLILSNV